MWQVKDHSSPRNEQHYKILHETYCSVVLDLEWYRLINKFNPKATTEYQQDRENSYMWQQTETV